jgi:hypothetical protein
MQFAMDFLTLGALPVPNFYDLPPFMANEIRFIVGEWNKSKQSA